jgi:hypothetical protein
MPPTLERRWSTPELCVVARTPLEESVLITCKSGWYGNIQGSSQTIQNESIIPYACSSCQGWVGS